MYRSSRFSHPSSFACLGSPSQASRADSESSLSSSCLRRTNQQLVRALGECSFCPEIIALPPLSVLCPRTPYAAHSWFASGTGAAGLVGALAWWLVRPLGVKLGLGILSFLPFLMAGAYLLILPAPEAIASSSSAGYTAVPTTEDEARAPTASRSSYEHEEPPLADAQGELPLLKGGIAGVKISFKDKLALLRPMLLPYIIPLVLVYLFEYTISACPLRAVCD